jgi:Protein of unknown function (DUF3052)
MGLEADCTVRVGDQVSAGRAMLETSELIFRGDFRLKIPFADVKSFQATRGQLEIEYSEGTAIFDLGRYAEQWARKIRYPSPLLDKLGVKPTSRVAVLGITDEGFWHDLSARTPDVARKQVPEADVVLYSAESTEALDGIEELIASMKRNGAIWVVYPKGKKHITELDVMAAGKQAGLVDVKIVSFSDTHSALKFVIPVALR